MRQALQGRAASLPPLASRGRRQWRLELQDGANLFSWSPVHGLLFNVFLNARRHKSVNRIVAVEALTHFGGRDVAGNRVQYINRGATKRDRPRIQRSVRGTRPGKQF